MKILATTTSVAAVVVTTTTMFLARNSATTTVAAFRPLVVSRVGGKGGLSGLQNLLLGGSTSSSLSSSSSSSSALRSSTNGDEEYDLVVIGAGSGGVRASRISSGYGKKVAIIEPQLEHGAPNYSAIGGTVRPYDFDVVLLLLLSISLFILISCLYASLCLDQHDLSCILTYFLLFYFVFLLVCVGVFC